MKATCPICGNYGPVENFLAQEDYKKALAELLSLPGDLPRQTVRYLAMFRRPGSDRALTGPRVLKIVQELKALAADKDIQWKSGRVYENKSAYWSRAIQAVLDRADQGKLERPLDGHNYLRSVAYGLAEKGFEHDQRKKEQDRSYRPDLSRPGHPAGPGVKPNSENDAGPKRMDTATQLQAIKNIQSKLRESK